jgi:small subunit ribosomal protein S1
MVENNEPQEAAAAPGESTEPEPAAAAPAGRPEPEPAAAAPAERPEPEPAAEPENEDFAAMYAESLKTSAQQRQVTAGEVVRGTVVGFNQEYVFVDIGTKSEAIIDANELKDERGGLRVGAGTPLEAYVVEVNEEGIRLSHSLARRAQSRQLIVEAQRSGVPLEGRVEEAIKGGYRVGLGEGVRAFCPISQIDIGFTEDAQTHVGQTYRFVVTQVKENERDVVVSRRRLLEAERAAQAEKTRETLKKDAQVRGRVTSIKQYGAFLDVGGVEGLLHVSEISHARVASPGDFLTVGQEIDVVVKSYDAEKGKLSLTRKPLEADPWERVGSELAPGSVHTGTIVRLADFGAFIELVPGLEGLLHVSEISPGKRIRHPNEVLKAGESLQVRVQSIDAERGRISLVRVFGDEPEKLPPLAAGSIFTGVVDSHAPFGAFVVLPGGLGRGLLPKEESGFDRGADLTRELPVGASVEVQVLDVGKQDGKTRIRLSRKSLQASRDRAELADYHAQQQAQKKPQAGPTLGSLGELLKQKGFRFSGE